MCYLNRRVARKQTIGLGVCVISHGHRWSSPGLARRLYSFSGGIGRHRVDQRSLDVGHFITPIGSRRGGLVNCLGPAVVYEADRTLSARREGKCGKRGCHFSNDEACLAFGVAWRIATLNRPHPRAGRGISAISTNLLSSITCPSIRPFSCYPCSQ